MLQARSGECLKTYVEKFGWSQLITKATSDANPTVLFTQFPF